MVQEVCHDSIPSRDKCHRFAPEAGVKGGRRLQSAEKVPRLVKDVVRRYCSHFLCRGGSSDATAGGVDVIDVVDGSRGDLEVMPTEFDFDDGADPAELFGGNAQKEAELLSISQGRLTSWLNGATVSMFLDQQRGVISCSGW